jgi:hypothetical protein
MPGEKPRRRGSIGSISQFTTLGNKATEHPDTKESENQNILTSSSESAQGFSNLDAKESISPNILTPKNQDDQIPSSQEAKKPSNLSSQELSTHNAQIPKNRRTEETEHLDVKIPKSQISQEPKRLIQVSEEELKRLMVEALQSQNTQASKSQKKPKRLRQTVYLEPDLHNRIRHRIADTGEDISDVVNLALRQLL